MYQNLSIFGWIIVSLCSLLANAQVDDRKFEKFQIEDSRFLTSSVAWHPTQPNICAIANTQGHPIYFYNTLTRTITKKLKISGFYAGPNISWSATGNWLLLEQKFYLDYSPNRDRKLAYEVLDVNSGKIILHLDRVHSACWSTDGKTLFALQDEKVKVYSFPGAKLVNTLNIPGAKTAIAMGSSNDEILINHTPTKEDLEQVPSIANNKKAMKPALKYRTLISVYNAKTGKRKKLIPELYDIVYSMKREHNRIFVYAKPHAKINPGAGSSGYVNQIDLNGYNPLYTGFQTNYIEPDYKLNKSGELFGIVSMTGDKMPRASLVLYETETGNIAHKFEPKYQLAQALRKQEFNDNRGYLLFLDNNEEVMFLIGNQIYQWKFR